MTLTMLKTGYCLSDLGVNKKYQLQFYLQFGSPHWQRFRRSYSELRNTIMFALGTYKQLYRRQGSVNVGERFIDTFDIIDKHSETL